MIDIKMKNRIGRKDRSLIYEEEEDSRYEEYERRTRPGVVIQQNIDFYIMKSEVNDSGHKSRKKEQLKAPRRKSRSRERDHSAASFDKLKQENQFLKERLHFVLNELDFYKKQSAQQRSPIQEKEDPPALPKTAHLDNIGATVRKSKGHFDIPNLKKTLIDKYIQNKKTDTSKKRSVKPKTNNNTTADKIVDNGSQLDVRNSMVGSQAQKMEQINDLLSKINKMKKPVALVHQSEVSSQKKEEPLQPKLRLFGTVVLTHTEKVLRGCGVH